MEVSMADVMPPERQRQFDLIEVASSATLLWARASGRSLEQIYPVVPFVDTDFSLDAWLFVDTETRIREYQADGTADALVSEFRAQLAKAGYPPDWLQQVSCHFGSKEIVDRDYKGIYYYFLR
jgi:nucleotide-binding universal stress UspA family protein